MLLQLKLYMMGTMYLVGILFMLLFPPRNFRLSGAKMSAIRSVGHNTSLNSYVAYKDLIIMAKELALENPEVVRMLELEPKTAQNRSVLALELRSDQQSMKPGILIIGALDGMAWGIPNAILELAEKLIHDTNYQTPFFNDYDWYLLPLGNPDGLVFTQGVRSQPPLNVNDWSVNLTARATTRPHEWHKNVDGKPGHEACFGTHINRNFAYHWQDHERKPPAKCSQFYPGLKPFSTSEAKAIRSYVDKLGDSIQLAIHMHANFVPKKDLILYPWRYTTRRPSNQKTLQSIGEYAARQARLPDGRLFEIHQSSLDAAVAGSLTDYLKGVVGTELVYVVKPYHQPFPNFSDSGNLESFTSRALSATLGLVHGWRSNTKQNTLSFFGVDVEF